MSAAAPEPSLSTPPAERHEPASAPPPSGRRRRVRLRALALQLLLPLVLGEPPAKGASPTTPPRRGLGAVRRVVVDGARTIGVQLVLPGLEEFVAAAAAALLRVVAPPPPPPPVLASPPPPRRPPPPLPRGWTPPSRIGGATPAPDSVRRFLPVLPEQVRSLDDRIRCVPKANAILSVRACLAFQDEAQVRLKKRMSEKRERPPSAYEPARPVFTLHECLDCEIGRAATAIWRFRRAAHARLNPKGRSTRRG